MTDCTCDACRRLAQFVRLDPDARAYQERWHSDDADAVLGLVDELRDRLRGRDIEIMQLIKELEAAIIVRNTRLAARDEAIKDLEGEIARLRDEIEEWREGRRVP